MQELRRSPRRCDATYVSRSLRQLCSHPGTLLGLLLSTVVPLPEQSATSVDNWAEVARAQPRQRRCPDQVRALMLLGVYPHVFSPTASASRAEGSGAELVDDARPGRREEYTSVCNTQSSRSARRTLLGVGVVNVMARCVSGTRSSSALVPVSPPQVDGRRVVYTSRQES